MLCDEIPRVYIYYNKFYVKCQKYNQELKRQELKNCQLNPERVAQELKNCQLNPEPVAIFNYLTNNKICYIIIEVF